jgi:hypothetical protein
MAPQANLRSRGSDSTSQPSNARFQIPDFQSEIASASENGRLIIGGQGSARDAVTREKGSRFTSVNASGTGKLASSQQDQRASQICHIREEWGRDSGEHTRDSTQRTSGTRRSEISEDAWLFRNLGGETHQVDRLSLIGGEHIAYHLNAKGEVDFLEASISDRSASSDRFSSVAQWQERIPIEEIQQRLTRARISVGPVENIEPVAFSSSGRVSELELTGKLSRIRLRRPQIRASLGLRNTCLWIMRPTITDRLSRSFLQARLGTRVECARQEPTDSLRQAIPHRDPSRRLHRREA